MSTEAEFYERAGTAQRNHSRQYDEPAPPQALGLVKANPVQQQQHQMTGERRWAASHDTFWGATQTYDDLPAGFYRTGMTEQLGPILLRSVVETDHLLDLPDDSSASIVREFEQFWKLQEAFQSRGFLHKRGFLLWGPPGSGKTSTLHILIKSLIRDHGGIVLMLDHPGVAANCLRLVRHIEPDRPMIAVMEDIDALIERYGENEFLALLDGEAQVDNVVFVATTNYPERLDKRFVDRPSRFDTVRFIGMPSADARRVYLQTKEPSLQSEELDQWVRKSKGFSVAHLKEMIIAVRCFGQSLDEVVKRLEAMGARKPSSEDQPDKPMSGFLSNGHAHA